MVMSTGHVTFPYPASAATAGKAKARTRLSAIFAALCAILLGASVALAAEKGQLKIDVLGAEGAVTKAKADVLDKSGKKVGEAEVGKSVALDPGMYKVVLPFVGGKIVKDDVKIEPGRTRTIQITNVAVLTVTAKDVSGKEPGFGVTVTGTNPPHDKVAEFLSGDSILIAPSQVDVKIDAPPQGYYWHGIELPPGRHANLELKETTSAELVVQPVMSNLPLDKDTRVVIYKAGTQSQISASDPGPEHRFHLDAGDYDVYVENHSGKGVPYKTDHGVHLDWGQKVERKVSLGEATANGN
jgi:hypothetical protein